jgi:hypothetical protein
MTTDAPTVSLTRDFADLLGAWTADDPELQDRCRLLVLPLHWPEPENADRA